MKISTTKPTEIIKPFDNVEIHLFGRNAGTTDWGIRDLNAETLYTPTPAAVRAFFRIQKVVARAKVSIIYAPHPAFDASFCNCGLLQTQFSSNNAAMIEADFPDNWSWVICRGVQADACDVPKGSAFWLSSADCPTLIVTDGEKVVCAHCGYKSLVDQGALKGAPTRPHFSVVEAVLEQFAGGDRRVNLRAFITLGIGPHFSEVSASEVESLKRYEKLATPNPRESYVSPNGNLDIVELVRCQCLNRRIGNIRVDDMDTFSDKDTDGKFKWWSHERAMKKSPADEHKRNGVLVIHKT